MSFITIVYETNNILDLINKFRNINLNNSIKTESSNFVIIDEDSYLGNYGGIFSKEMILEYENKKVKFIYDLITDNLCLIWFQGCYNDKGDMSLCKDGFVLITKNMYEKIQNKTCFKKIKTSYY